MAEMVPRTPGIAAPPKRPTLPGSSHPCMSIRNAPHSHQPFSTAGLPAVIYYSRVSAAQPPRSCRGCRAARLNGILLWSTKLYPRNTNIPVMPMRWWYSRSINVQMNVKSLGGCAIPFAHGNEITLTFTRYICTFWIYIFYYFNNHKMTPGIEKLL